MKFKKVSLLMAFLCAGLLVGCKATPDTEAITQKGNISEVIEKNKTEVGKDTIRTVIKSPETEKFDLVSESGKTTVNVDAKVVVPETNGIPAAKVVNRDLSTLDLEALSKYFFNGEEYRYARGLENMSKPEIAEMMEQIKSSMEDDSDYEEFSDEEKEQIKQSQQDYLLRLQEYYDKAPETVEEIPVEYKLKDSEEEMLGENAKTFSVESTQEGVIKNFTVFTGDYFNSVGFYSDGELGNFEGYFDGYENKCKYSEEEAEQHCEEILKQLGVSGEYQMVRCVPTVALADDYITALDYYNGYQISYRRVVNGVDETCDATYLSGEQKESEEPMSEEENMLGSMPQQYETMEFLFNKDGLSNFNWMEPMTVDSVIAENLKMISYKEAIKIFKDKVFKNSAMLSEAGMDGQTEDENAENNKVTCTVNQIKLGLMRVKNKDSKGEYTLIPVWDFYGTYDGSSYDTNNSYLTVNAMDGSIIDRSIGY